MKVVLLADEPVPERLREMIARGSTSLEERGLSHDMPADLPDADRIVFWSSGADDRLRRLAARYAKEELTERREAIVFVTTEPGAPVAGLSNTEWYVWPQDEDRLEMAFLTGA
jgi:hypothetical protein